MRALYVGRFQPFHLGHLDAIKSILKEVDRVLIMIGSAEYNYLPENPFTAGERFEMIEAALTEAGISQKKFVIIPVRNIENYDLWVRHLAIYLPKFDVVYTGSTIVKKLFENDIEKH